MHTHANNPYQHPSDPVIPSNTIWYFAYGSNLTSETFRAHRGITPLAAISVRVPGWMLVFDIYGIPYSEPAFASILPIQFHDNGAAEKTLAVHGTAYLLDRESFVSVVASEGGGTAYDEVEVLAVPVSHQHSDGPINSTPDQTFSVTTLIRAYGPTRARCPSRRYQHLIYRGAQESGLPQEYQQYLARLPCYEPLLNRWQWRWVGSMIFLACWKPPMAAAERLTRVTGNWDGEGHCPHWVQTVVRVLVMLMWLYHDHVHAIIWGRGDGLWENNIGDSTPLIDGLV